MVLIDGCHPDGGPLSAAMAGDIHSVDSVEIRNAVGGLGVREYLGWQVGTIWLPQRSRGGNEHHGQLTEFWRFRRTSILSLSFGKQPSEYFYPALARLLAGFRRAPWFSKQESKPTNFPHQ